MADDKASSKIDMNRAWERFGRAIVDGTYEEGDNVLEEYGRRKSGIHVEHP